MLYTNDKLTVFTTLSYRIVPEKQSVVPVIIHFLLFRDVGNVAMLTVAHQRINDSMQHESGLHIGVYVCTTGFRVP